MAAETVFGVHTKDPAAAVTAYPGITVERVFIPGQLDLGKNHLVLAHQRATAPVLSAGLAPIVSFKLDPREVLAGKWRKQLTDYAMSLHDPINAAWGLVYWHEPENDMEGPLFAAAFTQVRETMKAANPNARVGYVAMAYQWHPGKRGGATRDPKPWRVDADFYGIDAYTGSRMFPDAAVWDHQGVRHWYDEVVTPTGGTGRWLVTERGFRGRSDAKRAEAIAADFAGLSSLGSTPLAVVYWNTPGAENDPDLVNGPLADRELARLVGTVTCPQCAGAGRVSRS